MAAESSSSFSVLAISIVGILSTVILLVSYYVFVMRCFLFHRHRSPSPPPLPLRRRVPSSPLPSSPRGLDHPTILSLPIVRFDSASSTPFRDCAVCLAEFLHSEKLRLLPACSHPFHMDCIDTWLQTSARCPLCRVPVSEYHGLGVVLDVRYEDEEGSRRPRTGHAVAMGDECIGVRSKEEPWSVQPIRRSFSMDSSVERMAYLEVQEGLRRERRGEEGSSAGVGSGRSMMRLFLTFGHGRSSRRAVMPLGLEDP